MEKGIPLPELPLDPPRIPKPPDPRAPLIHGLVWTALGGGAMLALRLIGPLPNAPVLWPLPLPIVCLGLGLMLYYAIASDRARRAGLVHRSGRRVARRTVSRVGR
jgi:hypothetical protein